MDESERLCVAVVKWLGALATGWWLLKSRLPWALRAGFVALVGAGISVRVFRRNTVCRKQALFDALGAALEEVDSAVAVACLFERCGMSRAFAHACAHDFDLTEPVPEHNRGPRLSTRLSTACLSAAERCVRARQMLRRQPFLQQRPALLAALLAAATAWSGAIAPALEALLQLVTIVFAKAAIVLLTALYLLVSLGHKCWWGRRLILSPSPEWTTTTSADPLRPRVRLADVSPELAAQLAAQISARHAQAPNSRQSLAETHGHNVATLLRHALNPGVQGQEIPNRVTHDRMTPDRMTPDRMTPDRVQAWLESPETFSEHLARLLSVRNKVETLVDRAHYADPAVIQNQLRSIMRALTPTTRILHTFYQVASSDTEPHRVVQIMKRLRRKHLTI